VERAVSVRDAQALAEIDVLIRAWQADEIVALRVRDAVRARDCRIRIGAFEYLRNRLEESATAA
jgi:hypothetical protein